MRSLSIAISVVSLSCLFFAPKCDAHHGGHAAAPAHLSFPSANPGAVMPCGSNGYAYRPVSAGYFGRRYGRGGAYRYNSPIENDNYHSRMKPVDDAFDNWNRAETRRLGALPKSAFVKEYNWPSTGFQQLAANSSRHVATKSNSGVH